MSGIKGVINTALASGWPKTDGVVNVSKVEAVKTGDRITGYTVSVVYEYAVDGARYESGVIFSGAKAAVHSNQAAAQKAARRYPAGEKVTVHYDKSGPSASYLDLSMPRHTELVIFTGILTMAGAGIGWLASAGK